MRNALFILAILVILSGFAKVSFGYEITPKCEKMLMGEMIWQVRDTQPQYNKYSDQALVNHFFKTTKAYEAQWGAIDFDEDTCNHWWGGNTSKLSAFDDILWVAFDIPIRDY